MSSSNIPIFTPFFDPIKPPLLPFTQLPDLELSSIPSQQTQSSKQIEEKEEEKSINEAIINSENQFYNNNNNYQIIIFI